MADMLSKPYIVALIPARGGSKGIPKKNIVPVGGHPLIAYTIAISKMSALISEAVVTTDSKEIAEISKRYSAEVPFLRPAEISRDSSLDKEFFLHYLRFLDQSGKNIPELIVHLRPSTPFRQCHVVDNAIQYMLDHPEATALRSAYETHLTPYKMFYKEGEFMRPYLNYAGEEEFYNLPRQVFPKAYIPNGVVDIARPSVLLEKGLLHGHNIKLWVVEKVPDIDVKEDLDYARRELGNPVYQSLVKYLNQLA
jgi:CMP-N,N'-diacetyllegionaminic acid synthase